MTSSAFPFLDGRTSIDGPIARLPRGRGRRTAVLTHLRRRLHRADIGSAERSHERQNETDAYLDRSGLSSVDWLEALARTGQR